MFLPFNFERFITTTARIITCGMLAGMLPRLTRHPLLPLLLALLILLPLYLTTLQTIPNGAEHYYTIDVGETQIVLNSWGTLHATGYPLYVMTGNVMVAVLRLSGVSAASAPGVTSLIYGLLALALLYMLALHLTRQRWISAAMIFMFGLTRTVWIHQTIAEIYAFGLAILVLLLLLALWRQPISGRVYWLALIGGLGVFHHRALLMAAPALLYAIWGELFVVSTRQRLKPSGYGEDKPTEGAGKNDNAIQQNGWQRFLPVVRRMVICLLLGLIGFLPYAYLPLRAQAGAQWVYGQPGTWDGFWDQFLGREASRFIGAPATFEGLLANFNLINRVLVTDLTLPGIILGLIGLLLALRNSAQRRAALTMFLSGGVAYGFHVLLYTDILSALILPITLSLALGWLWLAEWILTYIQQIRIEPQRHGDKTESVVDPTPQPSPRVQGGGAKQVWRSMLSTGVMWAVFIGYCVILVNQNWGFIHELTSNRTGLETIELAKSAPPGSTLMLDWGPRHFAVGFARDVQGELPGIGLVDHKADFKAIIQQGELVTADFTFYNRPVSWWQEQLGVRVYLRAAAPHLVQIDTQPLLSAEGGTGLRQYRAGLVCSDTMIELKVDWFTAHVPDYDLSVFVHLLDSGGIVIAQADQAAPVYGWRPLTSWEAGEVVRDIYPLPRLPNGVRIQYGLYRQLDSGAFVNEYEYEMPVQCEEYRLGTIHNCHVLAWH
jgi:Protein of unknown function (DUF2723)